MDIKDISSEELRKLASSLKQQGITNDSVLNIMSTIQRHIFVEPALRGRAYDFDALPIGFNQTISSPYIVAKMTQLLIETESMENVLEIGTGCGYQACVLSNLFEHVTTIERIKPLYEKTSNLLKALNYKNISSIYGDGFEGCKLNAPYDAIIMTASPSVIPDELVSQLKPNGRMVLPLNINGSQKLYRIKNTKKGILKKEVDDVLFVPMLEGII
ncbi:MAG: protein-L-isoaspartate(D-aspartate) O-methyltransferase [Gammaproteobacteria bacterium]|nr:protein-L-isoaspartate(D-aspartate) O-methyltransferase [Gammaproteobacteria bacterium]